MRAKLNVKHATWMSSHTSTHLFFAAALVQDLLRLCFGTIRTSIPSETKLPGCGSPRGLAHLACPPHLIFSSEAARNGVWVPVVVPLGIIVPHGVSVPAN